MSSPAPSAPQPDHHLPCEPLHDAGGHSGTRVWQVRNGNQPPGRRDAGESLGGFSAWSPDLLGCVAAAATYEECVALMREAIAGHLEVMREHGDPIPVPSAINAFTVVAV